MKNYQIMGVLNANADSFYSQSRFNESETINKIEEMMQEGADIIDIGAVSSKPGSISIDGKDELERLKPIFDVIYAQKIHEKVQLSLDSYSPLCISYALERGFHIINDISGLQDDAVCKLIGEYKAKAILMHMQGSPQSMQDNPRYENILEEVNVFFKERIQKAESFGVNDITLDVGIGFGKTLEHNITLIKNISYFKGLGKELLIGASRKSMINLISPSTPQERLPGTLAIHLKAYDNGAKIIRTHDVKEHVQAFKVHSALH